MPTAYLLAAFLAACLAGIHAQVQETPGTCDCSGKLAEKPVCGTDGFDYKNICLLKDAQKTDPTLGRRCMGKCPCAKTASDVCTRRSGSASYTAADFAGDKSAEAIINMIGVEHAAYGEEHLQRCLFSQMGGGSRPFAGGSGGRGPGGWHRPNRPTRRPSTTHGTFPPPPVAPVNGGGQPGGVGGGAAAGGQSGSGGSGSSIGGAAAGGSASGQNVGGAAAGQMGGGGEAGQVSGGAQGGQSGNGGNTSGGQTGETAGGQAESSGSAGEQAGESGSSGSGQSQAENGASVAVVPAGPVGLSVNEGGAESQNSESGSSQSSSGSSSSSSSSSSGGSVINSESNGNSKPAPNGHSGANRPHHKPGQHGGPGNVAQDPSLQPGQRPGKNQGHGHRTALPPTDGPVCLTNGETVSSMKQANCALEASTDPSLGVRCLGACKECKDQPPCPTAN